MDLAADHMIRTGRRGSLFELQMAFRDLRASLDRLSLAWALAWQDVIARYRGSILGPFWITISMGLMVLGIGVLNGQLFSEPLKAFMPFVALGIVFFGVISGTINEGCDTFIQAAGMLSQTALPMFLFVWRTVFRNLINMAHHMVIVLGVLAFYGYWKIANLPGGLLGLVLLVFNAAWLSMLVAIASARFRDIPQIVASILQFAIFMTPVFWMPSHLGRYRWILDYNPLYHMLEAVRAPLMGAPVAPHTYLFLLLMGIAGWAVTFGVFTLTRRRIVHYL
jgi:ABC-type polysaccharide/polyol phosphate export permease